LPYGRGKPTRTPARRHGSEMPMRDGTAERREELYREAMALIASDYASDLQIESVARSLATSRRQLQRAFSEVGATTFRDELAKVRMHHARVLLSADEIPVRAVAVRVGYHQPAQFAKSFRPDAAVYRKELYEPYHAARPPVPPELDRQFAEARDFFESFGWTVTWSEDHEADDLLGSYARAEEEAGGAALVLTGDRDMYQCATGRTKDRKSTRLNSSHS